MRGQAGALGTAGLRLVVPGDSSSPIPRCTAGPRVGRLGPPWSSEEELAVFADQDGHQLLDHREVPAERKQ